jgi:alpha-tubulin suppressor-like RCC1 family protein
VAVAACAEDATGPATILVAPDLGDSVFVGRARTVVLLSAHDSAVVTASPARWTSSDTTVIVVAAPGRALAIGAGRATLTAELDGRVVRTALRAIPFRADGGTPFVASATGFAETCAVSQAGVPYCSEPSVIDSAETFAPVPGAPSVGFREFHSSRFHRCGLTTAGQLYCSGANSVGQLGLGSASPRHVSTLVPSASATAFLTISVGGVNAASAATCGVRASDSVVVCVGTANVASDTVFQPVDGGFRALGIALGRGHACAIGLDRAAYCWGNDARGLVGPVPSTPFVPYKIPGGDRFVQIASGSHACGITEQRELKCWGSNQNGQLGIGAADEDMHLTPERVDLGEEAAFVHAGNSSTCAVTVSGALYCWGAELTLSPDLLAHIRSRLGAPVRLAAGTRFTSLMADPRRVCGVTVDRAIVCL